VDTGLEEFMEGKNIKFTQHLGENVYVTLQTPYKCVDIRQFWIVPGTEQLHPTKIGIPLTFQEYGNLMKLVEQKIFGGQSNQCEDQQRLKTLHLEFEKPLGNPQVLDI